ncbi:hypothetical protein [Brevibacillus sp. BC25]|uniref:hypothetical protein n=1 Tax=Brevibacillus sp. BC25 TaxID=1144308 RepID=UPI00027137C0|nr:hypothetical protein [Brevibacillus sp. BC25]EJL30019.1 hypothetical protein PMI05_01635 [Brevibacillus sp. BC25]
MNWMDSDPIISTYSTDDYIWINLGVQKIDPKKIIGLSLQYEKVIQDEKMVHLKQRVKENGLNDPCPQDLDLALIPSGNYIVTAGGNHRAVLANELGLSEIEASVDAIVPKLRFKTEQVNEVETMSERINQLYGQAREQRNDQTLRCRIYDEIDSLEEAKKNLMLEMYYSLTR